MLSPYFLSPEDAGVPVAIVLFVLVDWHDPDLCWPWNELHFRVTNSCTPDLYQADA